MKLIKDLYNRILSFFKLKKGISDFYRLVIVPELPRDPKKFTVYVEGNKELNDFWYALFYCPCGCGEKIMLNLINDSKPCWEIEINEYKFSIAPSIWRTKNCASHFWLKDNKIIWC